MLYDPKWKPEKKPEKVKDTWQDILSKARNLIKEKGWTKDKLTNDNGSFCMVGALQQAAFGAIYGSNPYHSVTCYQHPNYFAYQQAVTAMASVLPKYLVIYEWNDTIAKSQRSVLAKFTEAINRGKPQE